MRDILFRKEKRESKRLKRKKCRMQRHMMRGCSRETRVQAVKGTWIVR